MENFIHFRAQSLPHLLALLLRPPKCFPPERTALLVVDTISGPFPSYFPHATELKSRLSQGRISDNHQLQWLLNRKWNVTSDLASHLTKLAAINRVAVLVLNQTHTKIKGQPRPTLYPALAGGSYESAVYSRIVLYRDWPDSETYEDIDELSARRVRFAEIMKRAGKLQNLRTEDDIIPFFIEDVSLYLALCYETGVHDPNLNRTGFATLFRNQVCLRRMLASAEVLLLLVRSQGRGKSMRSQIVKMRD